LFGLWKDSLACYNQPVPHKVNPSQSIGPFPLSRLNLLWGLLAVLVWAGEQIYHSQQGTPFSMPVFGKGLLLLLEATAIYYFSARFFLKEFWFLGLFPLLWLAASQFQWQLCTLYEYRYWLWLVLFLASEILILTVWDGKKLLVGLTFFWVPLTWLFKFSFLLPLTFLTAPRGRFENSQWVRTGGILAALALYLIFKGRFFFQFVWVDLYELLFEQHFLVFFLLGWLGMIALDKEKAGTYRHVLFPMFLLMAGFLCWSGLNLVAVLEFEILKWVLVFMAGFGFEAFRQYLINPSWAGRAVWLALGIAFFAGVV
jgi:hypothetical protein